MQNKIDYTATYSIGKVLSSGLHFACKAEEKKKPCPWSHVEAERRQGLKSSLELLPL